MKSFRHERLQNHIAQIISTMLVNGEIRDYRIANFLAISSVHVSKDSAYAKVFVSGYSSKKELESSVQGLNNASGYIQKILASRLRMRQTPKLTFICDFGIIDGIEISERIKSLKEPRL